MVATQKRVLSLWLPHWPTDRLARSGRRPEPPAPVPAPDRPLVLVAAQQGTHRVTAPNPAAAARGIAPGMVLPDARALCPELRVRLAEPARDARALAALADWCGRYSPWVAVDGADGLRLEVTGCAHLFGGEAGGPLDQFRSQLVQRLVQVGPVLDRADQFLDRSQNLLVQRRLFPHRHLSRSRTSWSSRRIV